MKTILATILMGFALTSNAVCASEISKTIDVTVTPRDGLPALVTVNGALMNTVQETTPESRLWVTYGEGVSLYLSGNNKDAIACFLTMLPEDLQDSIKELMRQDSTDVDVKASCEEIYTNYQRSVSSPPSNIQNAILGGLFTCLERVKEVFASK